MFWGLLSQEHVLKVGCQVWGSNPSLLKEKVRVVNSLFVGCHTKSVVYGNIVSLSLLRILVVVSRPAQRYKSCSASFWISFTENFPVCSHRFNVTVGGGELRILLCRHPEQEHPGVLSLENINKSSKIMRRRSPGMSSEGLQFPYSSLALPHHLALDLCITGIQQM